MLNLYNVNNNKSKTTPPSEATKTGASKKPNYLSYNDPSGDLPSEELKWGFWIAKNRPVLYKIGVGALVFINVILFAAVIYYLVILLINYNKDQQVFSSLVKFPSYNAVHKQYGAIPLQVVSTNVLSSNPGKQDLVAEVVNPNQRFLADLDYYFIVDGNKSETKSTIMLPGESRPIVLLGYEGSVAGIPQLVIEKINWQRISIHEVGNVAAWQTERLNFPIDSFNFLRSLAIEGANPNAVQFKIINNSAFNYKEPEFLVTLLQNQSMVGILPLKFDNFSSQETKTVDLRTNSGIVADSVQVFPLINIYDKEAYFLQ